MVDQTKPAVSVELNGLHIDDTGIRIEHLSTLENIRATLRFYAERLEMMILYSIELENGVAIVDYDDEFRKALILYVYNKDTRLSEVMEMGQLLDEKRLVDLRSRLDGMLFRKENPKLHIVDSYEPDSEEKLTKLLVTDFTLELY